VPLIRNLNHPETYDGIRVLTSPGTHGAAADLICSAIALERRSEAAVLEIGAGHGAFSRRLLDCGFADITAWDLEPETVKAPVSRIEGVDLNADFVAVAAGRTFDLIVGLELIEHLENPWAFMRGCAKLLRPGGLLVISTPNIQSAASRIEFLRNGRFTWFRKADVPASGHISPLSRWQVDLAASRAGLKRAGLTSNTEDAVVVRSRAEKRWIKPVVALVLSPLMRGRTRGEILVFAFRLAQRSPAAG